MTPEALLAELTGLADAAGLEVRRATGRVPGEPELPVGSGVCRVRDQIWVVLSKLDSVEDHIEVLIGALRAHAGELLESRYLPPAVRDRLES